MNTFLPYRDFTQSAACLDRQRLGKQRVEVLQILRALNGETTAWRNHPVVRMWEGHVPSLVCYGVAVCREWIGRGYKDTCLDKITRYWDGRHLTVEPPWLTDEFCRSHRSNLVRKLPEHYCKFFPDVPDDLPYIWPGRGEALHWPDTANQH